MVQELMISNITDNIGSTIAGAIANLPGMDMLMKISQAVGIVVLIYILMLIIKNLSAV